MLEYQLPMSSRRLDCLVTGRNDQRNDNAVIIELKQWDRCSHSDGEREVITPLGFSEREVLHPSVQVGQYKTYLEDTHTAFYAGAAPIGLNACSYLHNYSFVQNDVLLEEKFKEVLEEYPVFSADDVEILAAYLRERLLMGEGLEVLRRVEEGGVKPSKRLMDHVGSIIKGKPEYTLLDEQLVAYDRVLLCARRGFHDKKKTVIIIKGGPGTGKSVIAINLMADLLLKGYSAYYATGSRAFTETLRNIIGSRGGVQFRYFNSFSNAPYNALDVLICDEAHRLRETSYNRFQPRRSEIRIPQAQELVNAAKVLVFFIDQDQVVRPDEIGSVGYIKEVAAKNDCQLFEYELDVQFRCAGSEAFVNWINNTLGISKMPNVIWNGEEKFDFRIFETPEELEEAIKEKLRQGFTARLTAGFCWEWSKGLSNEGSLREDVVVGEFRRPWNARPEANCLPAGIPRATLWAYDPKGINQVGCIYTAQGFEFDYVGVIFGPDLTYDLDAQQWKGHPENSGDPVLRRAKHRFVELVKNTYRVLLSRGLKGCYVHFMDKDTERFFKSRIEIPKEEA